MLNLIKNITLIFLLMVFTCSVTTTKLNPSTSCNLTLSNLNLNLVVVVEFSEVTAKQANAVISNLETYLSNFIPSLSNDTHFGSQLALITYNAEATFRFSFTDKQSLKRFFKILKDYLVFTDTWLNSVNIANALRMASKEIDEYNSRLHHVPVILLYAATYDAYGVMDPTTAAKMIKADNIQIVTVTYEVQNGVTTPYIAKLASPGLALSSRTTTMKQFGEAMIKANCAYHN